MNLQEAMLQNFKPICPYCGNKAILVTGEVIYTHRSDLYDKLFWLCEPCNAYTGCHKNSNSPLGVIANGELRKAKIDAHNNFDKLWRNNNTSRKKAYKWLANELSMPEGECHIGYFDLEKCNTVAKLDIPLEI